MFWRVKNHQHQVLAKNILLPSLSKSFTNLMHYVLKETFKILENNENEDRRKLPAHLMMRFYDFSVKLLKMPKNPHKKFLNCLDLHGVDLTEMIFIQQ